MIHVKVQGQPGISVQAKKVPAATIQVDGQKVFGRMDRSGIFDDFQGPYSVTPRVDAQTLETKEKTTRQDIVVEAIPFFEVSNPLGETIIIGG